MFFNKKDDNCVWKYGNRIIKGKLRDTYNSDKNGYICSDLNLFLVCLLFFCLIFITIRLIKVNLCHFFPAANASVGSNFTTTAVSPTSVPVVTTGSTGKGFVKFFIVGRVPYYSKIKKLL